jgi:hypothetical protein
MMLKVVWRQNYLLLFTMEIDFRGLLGLKPWWIFKLGFLKSDWDLVINPYGLPLEKVSM